MNRSDPSADRRIRSAAPAVHAWIGRLARGDFGDHRVLGALALDEVHAPLLAWIGAVFVPVMRQNRDAWVWHRDRGETRFNEAAFDAGRALYEGTLLGRPFRAVSKTFQVRVWDELLGTWESLDARERARLAGWLGTDLDADCGAAGRR